MRDVVGVGEVEVRGGQHLLHHSCVPNQSINQSIKNILDLIHIYIKSKQVFTINFCRLNKVLEIYAKQNNLF